jgi:hypothetical protein
MVEILTFEQAISASGTAKRHLLLGNGFSIACERRIFNYNSLYAEAAEAIQRDMPQAYALFEQLDIKDFEEVIRRLEYAKSVLPFYLPDDHTTLYTMGSHADQLKDILIATIANKHPDFPGSISDEKFMACRTFLSYFINPTVNDGKIYTLNYDLLLYWTLLHKPDDKKENDLSINDGFGKDEPEDDYIVWKNEDHTRDQKIFYIHGAVHLFDTGTELEKYTWVNTDKRLIDQAREALSNNLFPLFVAEGKSASKLQKIKHQPYLHHCYKSFLKEIKEGKRKSDSKKSLFIFGHSLADTDKHIFDKIGKGTISSLFISIYGDQFTEDNQRIIKKAQNLKALRDQHPLDIYFYSAESAQVWGQP